MNTCKAADRDTDPASSFPGEVAQLLAGLERQKEELGPIADELIGLLQPELGLYPEELG